MTKHLLLLCAAFLASALVHSLCAQETAPPFRRYATQAYMTQLAKNYPGLAEARGAIERHTFQFRRDGVLDTLFIPVVFHLLDNGNGGTPTPEDVAAQLERLNTDFYTLGHPYSSDDYRYGSSDASAYLHPADRKEGFAQRAARPMIRFCRPQQNPNTGGGTNGIVQVSNGKYAWGQSDSLKRAETGGSTPWNPEQYCNVWVARLADGTAGYAQMPGGPSATDGIVVDERYFARSAEVFQDGGSAPANVYGIGRTLCHLMGSYLNLYELWNDSVPCADDLVDDTPVHNAPNYRHNRYRHVSLCQEGGRYPVEMTMNLMDSTPDTAQYLFTHGQVARMQACLAPSGPRHALTLTPAACDLDLVQGNAADRAQPDAAKKPRAGDLQLRVFPNPSTGDFSVEVAADAQGRPDILDIRIFSALGAEQWRSGPVSTQGRATVQIPAGKWPAGLYTVRATVGGQQRAAQVLLEK